MYRVIMKIGYCETAFDFACADEAANFISVAVRKNVDIDHDYKVEISMKYVKEGGQV